MFDGAAMATAADVVAETVPQTATPIVPEGDEITAAPETVTAPESNTKESSEPASSSADETATAIEIAAAAPESSDDNAVPDDGMDATGVDDTSEAITSIVFVDTDVENPEQLVSEIIDNLERG